MKSLFIISRVTTRRHIRVGEDNLTKEVTDEVTYELEPNDMLKPCSSLVHEDREVLARANDLELDIWEGMMREMRTRGFETASKALKPDAPTTEQPSSAPFVQPPTGERTPPGDRWRKATHGQLNKIKELYDESQLSQVAFQKEMTRLSKNEAAKLLFSEASHMIDLMIAAKKGG